MHGLPADLRRARGISTRFSPAQAAVLREAMRQADLSYAALVEQALAALVASLGDPALRYPVRTPRPQRREKPKTGPPLAGGPATYRMTLEQKELFDLLLKRGVAGHQSALIEKALARYIPAQFGLRWPPISRWQLRRLRRQDVDLTRLSDREHKVLALRHGWDDGQRRTLGEVGAVLGASKERARQIEQRALKKLAN